MRIYKLYLYFFSCILLVFALPSTVQAKSYKITKTFANTVKNGKLPGMKAKVGTSYTQLKKIEKKGEQIISPTDPKVLSIYVPAPSNIDTSKYTFFNRFGSDKVESMSRDYNYTFSTKTVRSYFGKPYKAKVGNHNITDSGIYKAGKYYMYFSTRGGPYGNTYIEVGTKKMILHQTGYTKFYR
ncbi:MAG: hypothetical protein ACRC0Q_01380 [Kurthia gibsonii]|uniref:hypothetical protein n=1 Tax=Kurthia gibsonii TaxID=33946 RepID=UPI002DB790DC|nr:hypothetical protein [Kurthia gibsonii]MEB7771564.1 hypothetical protein [Kurthia gibsonii]